jgi:peptidoglycan biosynthesis protein MviN/MurJ (putative lipid II flippase)
MCKKLWDLPAEDPWLAVKFVAVTVTLGLIGKLILLMAVDGCGLHPAYAQFVPTVPMFALTFSAHRYLWRRQDVSMLSYIGGLWTAAYVVKFVLGHGAFSICTGVLGWEAQWQYLTLSSLIGTAMAAGTFVCNELVLGRLRHSKIATE